MGPQRFLHPIRGNMIIDGEFIMSVITNCIKNDQYRPQSAVIYEPPKQLHIGGGESHRLLPSNRKYTISRTVTVSERWHQMESNVKNNVCRVVTPYKIKCGFTTVIMV